jgi:hypothetical protein
LPVLLPVLPVRRDILQLQDCRRRIIPV